MSDNFKPKTTMKPEEKSDSLHTCVLCNAKMGTKEELQDHFRKHANKEIDSKGRPRKSGGAVGKSAVSRGGRQNNKPVATTSTANTSLTAAIKTESSTSTAPSILVPAQVEPVPEVVPIKTAGNSKPKAGKKAQPIACDVCGHEFDTVTMAIQHKFRKHPNSAIKHFCPYCGMQFPLKINRDMHLNNHPEPRPTEPFPCNECGVMFYTSQAQSYHYKSTHKRIVAFFKPVVTPPPSKKIKVNNAGEAQSVYYCHLCGYEYIVKFNLQKHLERQHPEEERAAVPQDLIKCTTCDALFYNKKAYDNHNMYHKPDDLYVTSEEQRLQTVTRVDQDFDIRRVQSAAEKFIPVYRPRPVVDMKNKPGNKSKALTRRKRGHTADDSDSELSLDSSSMSSSSSNSSDSDEPLQVRVQQRKKRAIKVQRTTKIRKGGKKTSAT